MYIPGNIVKEKYYIKTILNESSMAGTYLALDDKDNKFVIKVLDLKGITDWKILQLFEREAGILKRLSYKGLPRYIDYFSEELEDNKIYYIIYEYIEGQSLLQLLESGKTFDYAITGKIVEQVLDILDYLHSRSQPVIHRDVNPKNIIITENDDIYLVDFGAGKKILDDLDNDDKTTFIGTYGYIPMEQMTGDAKPASDIYALGMTAIHLLSGENPANLPMVEMKPQYRKNEILSRLDRIIDLMIEPDINKRGKLAGELRNLILNVSLPIKSQAAGSITVHYNKDGKIQIRKKDNKEILVSYNDANTPQIPRLLLDLWITKPWLIFIILSAFSAGSFIIPFIILYLHPKARGWVNKIYRL